MNKIIFFVLFSLLCLSGRLEAFYPQTLMVHRSSYYAPWAANCFPVRDYNEDGYLDYIVKNGSVVNLYYGGSTIDSLPAMARGGGNEFVNAGDLNRDGKPDFMSSKFSRQLTLYDGADFMADPLFVWEFNSDLWFATPVPGPPGEGRDMIYIKWYYPGMSPWWCAVFDNLAEGDTTPVWSIAIDDTAYRKFGTNPSFGDVNGNGYPDMLVQSGYYNDPNDSSLDYAFFSIILDFLEPDLSRRIDLEPWHVEQYRNDRIVILMAGIIEDVTGDGLDDIYVVTGHYAVRALLLYYGDEDVYPVGEPDFIYVSGAFDARWVANIGDVNADGYDDLGVSMGSFSTAYSLIFLGGPNLQPYEVARIGGEREYNRDQYLGRRILKGGDFLNIGVDLFFVQTHSRLNFESGGYSELMVLDASFLEVSPSAPATPENLNLLAVYPNPFNQNTRIEFNLAQPTAIQLKVYSINGESVRDLVYSDLYSSGSHSITWDGKDNNGNPVSSGVYLFSIQSKTFKRITKGLLMR